VPHLRHAFSTGGHWPAIVRIKDSIGPRLKYRAQINA